MPRELQTHLGKRTPDASVEGGDVGALCPRGREREPARAQPLQVAGLVRAIKYAKSVLRRAHDATHD